MTITGRLKKRALGLSQRAMERLFADEKRAMQIANAIGAVQRGKEAIDTTQASVMHQFSFATRQDFKDLGRAISSLRRKAQALSEKLGAVASFER